MNRLYLEAVAKKLDQRAAEWAKGAAEIDANTEQGRIARTMFLHFAQEAAECADVVRNMAD